MLKEGFGNDFGESKIRQNLKYAGYLTVVVSYTNLITAITTHIHPPTHMHTLDTHLVAHTHTHILTHTHSHTHTLTHTHTHTHTHSHKHTHSHMGGSHQICTMSRPQHFSSPQVQNQVDDSIQMYQTKDLISSYYASMIHRPIDDSRKSFDKKHPNSVPSATLSRPQRT